MNAQTSQMHMKREISCCFDGELACLAFITHIKGQLS